MEDRVKSLQMQVTVFPVKFLWLLGNLRSNRM